MTDTDDFLEHYGVPGMKWGKRKSVPTKVQVNARAGRKVKVKGGTGQKPHDDAIRAAVAGQKVKKSSLDSLSNKELKDLVNRMNLEKQFHQLSTEVKPASKVQKGHNAVKGILAAGATVNAAIAFATSPAGKALASQLKMNIKS